MAAGFNEKSLLTDLQIWWDEQVGKDDPFVRAALQGSTPAAVAKSVVSQTKLGDVAVRKSLFEGGAASLTTSDDPMAMKRSQCWVSSVARRISYSGIA